MSFLSGLKVFGKDIVKVFTWGASEKGQAVISESEKVLVAAVPAAKPIVDLFNYWAQKAYLIESLAVASGQATGTGPEKSAITTQNVAPEVADYVTKEGLAPRTPEQVQKANDAVIAFINAMTQPAQ